ncbi:MAG: hypothetical protein H6739_16280 [Alphaproteobacteria bacterium]|nr:hypothetical protein [Alphaproteobacteria bacterium]
MMEWLNGLLERLSPPAPRFEVDADGVRRYRGARLVEQARWATLREVGIVTTADGPFGEDLFWLFIDEAGGCAVPNGQVEALDLFRWLRELEGFDYEAVALACGSTVEASFRCWSRE